MLRFWIFLKPVHSAVVSAKSLYAFDHVQWLAIARELQRATTIDRLVCNVKNAYVTDSVL